MDEADLVELPAAQASKAQFPPGCCVWIHSDELVPSGTLNRSNGALTAPQFRDYNVREGKVQSVYLGDVFSSSRKFFYKVDIDGDCGTEVIDERKVAFAKNVPVLFIDDHSDGCSTEGTAQKGEILTSMLYANTDSGKIQIIYSLITSSEDKTLLVKHGVQPGQLRFRFDNQIERGSLNIVDQCAPLTDSKSKSPPPGFAPMLGKETSEDGSFVLIAAKKKNNSHTKTAELTEPRSFAIVAAERGRSAAMVTKKLQIPYWLVASESSRKEVIDTLTHSTTNIYQSTGCKILIEERTSQVWLALCDHLGQGSGIKRATEILENKLVHLVGQEESRGRLLYDIAMSYADDVRPDGVVFQRNPLNSCERVWMCLVDFPAEVHDGVMKYIISPFVSGETYYQIHQANCTMKICRDSFGVKLFRCRHYALILGKQAKSVSAALVIAKNALKRFKQNKMYQTSYALLDNPVPSRWDGLPDSKKVNKKVAPKPVIVAIPEWLMLDVSFQQQIKDGLFGNLWCKKMEVGEKTGSDVLLSQNHILVTPKYHTGQNGQSVTKAIHMVEDSLVSLIGTEEVKCKLLYDLTESYSEVCVDGIIQMRNPLNSCELIWACVMDVPVVINKDNEQQYVYSPFMSSQTDYAMHKLKCSVKICRDNFDIKLHHCRPYAMIMGRQKNNVSKAIQFIKKLVNSCQKNTWN